MWAKIAISSNRRHIICRSGGRVGGNTKKPRAIHDHDIINELITTTRTVYQTQWRNIPKQYTLHLLSSVNLQVVYSQIHLCFSLQLTIALIGYNLEMELTRAVVHFFRYLVDSKQYWNYSMLVCLFASMRSFVDIGEIVMNRQESIERESQ